MLKDLKHAARTLMQNKSWTAVVVLSLALGIGANTALFSAVNGLLLETVPVPAPDTLVRLRWAGQNDMVRNTSEYGSSRDDRGEGVTATFSYEMFQTLRGANQTLIDVAAAPPRARRILLWTAARTSRPRSECPVTTSLCCRYGRTSDACCRRPTTVPRPRTSP